MNIELPTQLAKLHALLVVGGDVRIADLHDALASTKQRDPRTAQQYVGHYIVRLNRRLKAHGKRVVPGRIKQTYTLADV